MARLVLGDGTLGILVMMDKDTETETYILRNYNGRFIGRIIHWDC